MPIFARILDEKYIKTFFMINPIVKTIDLNRDSSFFRCTPTKLQKYSKVKVCVKNRKVLKAKAKGRKYIVMK